MKLITTITANLVLSEEAMGKIMTRWNELQREVYMFASGSMPQNAELEWRMVLRTKPNRPGWRPNKEVQAVCSVFLTIPVNILEEKGESKVQVPLTVVQDIFIEEDGRFFWHAWRVGDEVKKLPEDIAEALVTGKYNGRNYQHNHFPRLAFAQEA